MKLYVCKKIICLLVLLQYIPVFGYNAVAHIPSMEVIHQTAEKRQLPFVIVIASYNNEHFVRWNLESALNQNYNNYRIIYHDDCSTDRTLAIVQEIVARHPKGYLVTVIHNEKRQCALQNQYEDIVYRCRDDEIVVILDGDDGIAHENVLRILNYVYSENDVWLTYGQYQERHSGAIGFCSPMPEYIIRQNSFRHWPDGPSHMRTFYAWLFKAVRKEDFMYHGEFMKMTGDLAAMLPMIEMARDHFQFIPAVLYIYNDRNVLSDHVVSKQLQREIDLHIRSLAIYAPLAKKPEYKVYKKRQKNKK